MPQELQEARQRVAQIAREMLTGMTDLVSGCRSILLLRHNIGVTESPALDTISAIESETDDYPIGPAREAYSAELLKRLDAEIAEYLNRVRSVLLEACKELIAEIESADE
jgi:hypothetical protein